MQTKNNKESKGLSAPFRPFQRSASIFCSMCTLFFLLSSGKIEAQTQLVTNGNFSLAYGWTSTGDFSYGTSYSNCEVCPGYGYASGSGGSPKPYLSGALSQSITIPSAAGSATLSFWAGATLSGSSSGSEKLVVYLVDITTSSELVMDNIYYYGTTGYSYHTYTVPSYLFGHSLSLVFNAQGGSTPTTIRVDEASLTYTSASSSAINVSGSLAFGNIPVGTPSTQTMVITNTGSAPLTIYSISCPSGFSGSWSGTIYPGNSSYIPITFTPTSATFYSGTISVSSNAATGSSVIACSGTGVSASTPTIYLAGSLSFGNIQVGTPSQQTMTITNTGSAELDVSFINYPLGFTGNWTGGTISAGGTRSVFVTFDPTSAISYGGSIYVSSNASSGANIISCSGTGISTTTYPSINVTGTLDFGNVMVGNTPQLAITIANTSSVPLSIYSISCPSGFSANWNAGTINPFSSQTVLVSFSPLSASAYGGTITINSNATTSASVLSCSGMGVSNSTPEILVSGVLNFGNITTGSSRQLGMTITNNGGATLNVTSIACTTGFTGNWNGSIVAGGIKNVVITFDPTTVGNYSGTINVYSNAGTGTISCSGGGIDGGSTDLTIPTGLTATAISGNTIKLSWNAENNATNYFVNTCDGTLLATPTTNSYSDNSLSPGTTRSYRVAANNNSVCSGYTDCQSATTFLNGGGTGSCNLNDDYAGIWKIPQNFDCQTSSFNILSNDDGYGFLLLNCTSYVAYKINEEWGNATTNGSYKFTCTSVLDHSVAVGSAADWGHNLDNIPGLHIDIDDVAAVGSVAWYDNGTQGTPDGHVAFVSCIDEIDPNLITLTEYNGGALDNEPMCKFGIRPIHMNNKSEGGNRLPTKFIHVEKLKNLAQARHANTVSIYPNPSKDIVNITLSGNYQGKCTLVIYDVTGQVKLKQDISNSSSIVVDASTWLNGLYRAQIIESNSSTSYPFQIIK